MKLFMCTSAVWMVWFLLCPSCI